MLGLCLPGTLPPAPDEGSAAFLLDTMTLQNFADDIEAARFTEEDVRVGRRHV